MTDMTIKRSGFNLSEGNDVIICVIVRIIDREDIYVVFYGIF